MMSVKRNESCSEFSLFTKFVVNPFLKLSKTFRKVDQEHWHFVHKSLHVLSVGFPCNYSNYATSQRSCNSRQPPSGRSRTENSRTMLSNERHRPSPVCPPGRIHATLNFDLCGQEEVRVLKRLSLSFFLASVHVFSIWLGIRAVTLATRQKACLAVWLTHDHLTWSRWSSFKGKPIGGLSLENTIPTGRQYRVLFHSTGPVGGGERSIYIHT